MTEPHKAAEVASRTHQFMANEATKPFGWDAAHFVEWATVTEIFRTLQIPLGGQVVDIGCGTGWTSLFLAEAGYRVTGYDLVPANVELARSRAERWGAAGSASFEVADMDLLPAGDPAEAALFFDALHHSARQGDALRGAAARLAPRGWLVLGEPTWLHRVSPGARRMARHTGWLERGLTMRDLRADLRAVGLTEQRRFFQPTRPYEGRVRGFAWQLARLAAANAWVAPQGHLWIAARRGQR